MISLNPLHSYSTFDQGFFQAKYYVSIYIFKKSCFLILQAKRLIWQSGKPSSYLKISKLHQFVYLIDSHHQKKVKVIGENLEFSITLFGGFEGVWGQSTHGKALDGVGSARATIEKKFKTIAFISAEIFLGGIFNIFIIFQKFQMQSGKPNHYPKFLKLHQFAYIIDPHHQKKGRCDQ